MRYPALARSIWCLVLALGAVPIGCMQNSEGGGRGAANGSCASDRDCPLYVPFCSMSTGQCVVCLSDSDCRPSGTCEQGLCYPFPATGGAGNGGAPNIGSGGFPIGGMGNAGSGAFSATGGDPPVSTGGVSGSGGAPAVNDNGNCKPGTKQCMPDVCYVANPANGCELGVGCGPCPEAPEHAITACFNGLCGVRCLSGYTLENGGCVPEGRPGPDSGI